LKEKNFLTKKGQVVETLPGLKFRVLLDDGKEAICHLGGKLKLHKIRILPGDRVVVEFSPYDETKGRIIIRE